MLAREEADLLLVDTGLPGISGLEMLRIVRENYALAQAVMMSAEGRVQAAVEAVKQGAYHFLPKDVEAAELLAVLRNAGEHQDLNRQVLALSAQVAESDREFIVGPSRATRDVMELVQRIAKLSATVLMLGESGTGKELLGAPDPPRGRAPGRPVHPGQPGGDPARARGEHAVRPREGVVHRRLPAADREVRAGGRRHAVPRRDRRPAPRPAGQAAARDPGGRDRARRRRPADPHRLPADRRDQRRPREGR